MNESSDDEVGTAGDDATVAADRTSATLATLAPALRQLAGLLADPHVTRAAAATGVSQPTLSRSIARWERELGVPLVRRLGRDIELTEEGRRLATAATRALEVLRGEVEALCGVTSPRSIGVGFQRSLGPGVVGELVASFHAQYPEVRVGQREGDTARLLGELETGELDVAVLAPRPDHRWGWLRLGTQDLALVVPSHHRLAGRDRVDLADTAGETYLALDQRFATRRQADALCAAAGFVPQVLLEADTATAVREYVAAGLGIAILPHDTDVGTRVGIVAIDSPDASREVGLVWDRRRLTPVADDFVEHAGELGRRYPGWADLVG